MVIQILRTVSQSTPLSPPSLPSSGCYPYLRACGCPHRFVSESNHRRRSPVRDRRRSKSQSSSNSASRSGTPTSASSGRTTPSPSPGLSTRPAYQVLAMEPLLSSPAKELESSLRRPTRSKSEDVLSSINKTAQTAITSRRFQTTCYLETKPVPVSFSSTIVLHIGSTRKKYVEQVNFKTRLVPQRFSESMLSTRTDHVPSFLSTLTIPCDPPLLRVLRLEQPQHCNATYKLTNGAVFRKEEFV